MDIKRLASALVCLGITCILLFAFWAGGFFSYFDTTLYDFFLSLNVKFNPRALNFQIVPVDLNDRSEMTLGERLNDRTAFGDLFSVVAYSRSQVALDFIFQGERENDRHMLEAAASVNGLFIAVVPVPLGRENVSYNELTADEKTLLGKYLWRPKEFGEGSIPKAGTFIMPFLEFGKLATQLCHIGVEPDPDGVYRRIPLFYAWEDGFIPSISLASALYELNIDGNDIEIHYGNKVLIPLGPGESFSIPIDESGNLIVPFKGMWKHTENRFSLDRLANAWLDKDELNRVRDRLMNSLCFVADTSFSKKDIGPVPMESYYPLGGLHTSVISGILDAAAGKNAFYREVPLLYQNICLVFFAVIVLLLGLTKKDWIFNTGFGVLFLAFSGTILCLWFFRNIMPWYGTGALAILFSWLLGFMYRFLSQRRRQSALERYVPRPVAQRLVAGQRTNLVPVYKELTILFSDIKAFTTWSADREAQEVHDFLNDYLESMADILFAFGGTVDKFMGDGILAFFGDPLDIPDHAGVAIKAAIAMQHKILELREKWQPLVGIDLKVRMGLNSGKVIVGDLGTRRRIEYTVIGSAVNLAQRMEGLARPGGILVTEFTRSLVDTAFSIGAFTFSEKQDLSVKGYDKPISAYEVKY